MAADMDQIEDTIKKTNSNSRRRPAQERSRSRVDAILNATRDIISEKGTGGLKIHDLAKRAGVTASSIYQYFPNKQAIIQALDQRYMNATQTLLTDRLQEVQNLEQGFQVLADVMDDYYQWYSSQPVISDIWYGLATDKSLHNKELASSRESAAIIMQALAPYISEEGQEEVETYALLLAHLAGSVIRLCVTTETEEASKLIKAYKKLIISLGLSIRLAETWHQGGESSD